MFAIKNDLSGWRSISSENEILDGEYFSKLMPGKSINSIIDEKCKDIKSKREKVKYGGVNISGNWFHSDIESRIQFVSLKLMGTNIPADLQWKTMSGDFVLMNKLLANSIFEALINLDINTFANSKEHESLCKLSDDPESYDFSSGWSQTYQESIA
jgi:hypothetical protein